MFGRVQQSGNVCRFYAQGRCRFGDACKNEHPGSGRPQDNPNRNSFSALGNTGNSGGNRSAAPSRGFQNHTSSSNQTPTFQVTKEGIEADLRHEKPQWPFSSYGPGRDAPRQLFGGPQREQSFEEMRVNYYLAAASGNVQPAISDEQARIQEVDQQTQSALNDLNGAVDYVLAGQNEHPNRIDLCQAPNGLAPAQQQQLNSFGGAAPPAASAPFGASSQGQSAFGQPSGLGQASAFGRPSAPNSGGAFGQPSTLGTGSAFGQPSAPGSGSAFGQPSLPGAGGAFGRPSVPGAGGAFGQPSVPGAFGRPSAPAQTGQSPFGPPAAASQPSQGLFGRPSQIGQSNAPNQQAGGAFGQPSSLGQSARPAFGQAGAFGQPAFGQSAFGQPSAPQQSAFGQTPNGTQQPQAPSQGVFGQPSQASNSASPFAQMAQQQQQPNASPSSFAPAGQQQQQQQQRPSPFGQPSQQQQPSPSPFGQPARQTAFSAPNTAAAAAATTSNPSPFSQPPPQQAHQQTNGTTPNPPPPSLDVSTYSTRLPNGALQTWKGLPVTYVSNVPYTRVPNSNALQRIWHPDGPPPPSAEVEDAPEVYEKAGQALEGAYRFLREVGSFEGGIMPEVPPRREWVRWDV